MNVKQLVLTAALIAAITGCSDKDEPKSPAPVPAQQGQAAAPAERPASERPVTATSSKGANHAPAGREAVSSRICIVDCLRPGPLVAASKAEAEWLVRHQYPSEAELNRMQALSLDALQQEASLGNPSAAAVLGKRISLEKDFLEGQVMLRDQALSGNFYAFYAMSESYREAKTPNLVDGAAYLRLAYILGDNKAASEIAKMKLTSIEIAAADSRASQLFKGFAGDQVPDPRPQE